jgi:pyruvate/2-oxoglutarate dehydrogenase complex dihydrolipoamide acyltransferase (E2) component
VTKQDILGFIDGGGAVTARPAGEPAPAPFVRGAADEVVPMSVMRRKIAEHMVLSKRTSAHVYSVFEVNYSRVDQIRKAKKDDYERAGAKLTFTSFIAKVAVDCLRRHKTINASIDGDNIIYRNDVNLGIAVALENGLIVPVVKAAGEKNTLGLSKAIQDIADVRVRRSSIPKKCRAARSRLPTRATLAPIRLADHQPAAGRHSRRRHDRKASGCRRRCDWHPVDGLPDAWLRSSPG